jgi:AraC-like DNA-binding protein
MKYVIAIGIFQALVAIILLFKSKQRSGADEILIFLVACIATHLLIKFVIFNFVGDVHVRLQMNTFLGFCYGPLLYLYTKKIKNPQFIPSTKWFVFIPFVLAMIGYFSVASVLVAAPQSGYKMLDWYNKLTFWSIIPTEAFYALLSLRIARSIPQTQFREIKLVKQIAFALLFLCFVGAVFFALSNVFQANILVRTLCYSGFVLLCVIILRYRFLSLQSMQEKKVYDLSVNNGIVPSADQHVTVAAITNLKPEEAEIKKSILTQEEQINIWNQLEVQMKTSKIFTDGALNLDKLTELTGISKYHISETLNSYGQKTFYQYVNEYRIQFAVDQMRYLREKGVPVNILSLAYDAGFNAKSSFNRYFKEITNQTPSDYLKSLQSDAPLNDFLNGVIRVV